MTTFDYNKHFYPVYNKAISFLGNLDHALSKCDDNARTQLGCVGWDELREKEKDEYTIDFIKNRDDEYYLEIYDQYSGDSYLEWFSQKIYISKPR